MERQFSNPVFIKHAGLIIVTPYLGMLFSKLELMINNEFVSSHAQQKAVQLLVYIASGTEETMEHELILHKVLSGLPISHPITLIEPLTETYKAMADSMLEAITQHWTAMSNTSIHGLRESFLMRDGKFEDHEDAIYLRIEQKAYDLLLDQIPWNIGRIKLNWMSKILEVSWR